ncbi:MAG: hypothetical protein JXR76_19370 [Deltaproteobacteria bacterium]|nr:hypothetical protein [Deltaproteobacteria bacterium]
MPDIYQQIWDADQSESGVPAILDDGSGDANVGYVKVNRNLNETDSDLRVLTEAVIPVSKQRTYALCRKLFNNYSLSERDTEVETEEEREEIHDLVCAIVDSAPMTVAKQYIAKQTGTAVTRERLYNTVMELWFRRFSQGGDPHLSGFEHVVVGEQEGATAQGYHFWYKYYLDDGFARTVDGGEMNFPGLTNDRIVYLGSKQSAGQNQFPESVTISYRWDAPDYDREKMRPLTKKIGGFFVGCSVEGLLAMGSVRAHLGAKAPKEAVINGARYNLKMYRSDDGLHIRTFYPVFVGAAPEVVHNDPPIENNPPVTPESPVTPVVSNTVRIIAALVNPEGDDVGRESVTLINTGSAAVSIEGWHLVDRNEKKQPLAGSIAPGETKRVLLEPPIAKLGNKGGTILLVETNENAVHQVSYSKGQVRNQGETILF